MFCIYGMGIYQDVFLLKQQLVQLQVLNKFQVNKDDMKDTIEQVKHYLRNFWENRWLGLATAVLLSMIGWVGVMVAPDRYEVTSRIYVDTRSMLKPLLQGIAVDSFVTESTAEIMKRTLMSRPNLEILAKKSGLDTDITSLDDYEKMINTLQKKILISGGREMNNIYTVSYSHTDPVMAKNIVMSLLDMFIEKVIGATRLDSDVSIKFLDQKISEYEHKLTEAEERLKNYKKQHPGVLITDDTTYFSRLEAMKTQLQTARLDLQEQKHRRAALQKQLKVTPRFTGGGTTGGSSSKPISVKINEVLLEIEGLKLRYSEQHPDVAEAKKRLKQLQARQSSGVTNIADERIEVPIITRAAIANPAHQTLALAYGEADAMVAALRTRVEEYKKRYDEMESNADTLPDIEAELASLNRDYVVNKQGYEELLKRRESANISEGVSKAGEFHFEVIDPPRIPLTPAGPNRIKWLTLVFILSLGAGVAVSLLLSLLNPKIYDKQTIKQLTTLPILGTVSPTDSDGTHFLKDAGSVKYSLASGVLFLVYGVLILAYLLNIDYVKNLAGYSAEQVEEQLKD